MSMECLLNTLTCRLIFNEFLALKAQNVGLWLRVGCSV